MLNRSLPRRGKYVIVTHSQARVCREVPFSSVRKGSNPTRTQVFSFAIQDMMWIHRLALDGLHAPDNRRRCRR
jgi:hypothetical protein